MYNFTPSQSPYSEDFESILDPDIRDLVMALLQSGCLPCYSCQGHGLHKPRYVILAFGSDESRQDFLKEIFPSGNQFGYTILKRSTLSTEVIKGQVVTHQTHESEIQGLNNLFLRNYEEYVFLKISIGMAVSKNKQGLIQFKIEQYLMIGFNLIFRNWLTKNLVRKISESKPTLS